MNVTIKKENFSVVRYDLQIKDTALEFIGEKEPFFLRYSQIMDFVITQDRHGKHYFTMITIGQLYEGTISDAQDIEPFSAALKDKLGGFINIEIRRS